jgi:oligopeptide/dipeptide ABC transporter ATP-binding protein
MSDHLLKVENVKKHFRIGGGFLTGTDAATLKAVDGVSFDISVNETLGLVGESGCGKSTTASLLLQLAEPTSGSILFQGQDINKSSRAQWSKYRRSVQAVLQDPFTSLNPRMRVRTIVAEPLVINSEFSNVDVGKRVAEVIEQVGLPAEAAGLYPHEFSGGQRQRIALARALAVKPKLIVLDEAVSGLDVSMKAQILNLLKDLQAEYGMAYLLISHNLADVQYLCDRVMVMYLGKIVEAGSVERVFSDPLHPYTRALLTAALPVDPDAADREGVEIAGEVPSPINPPKGCAFHTRCPMVMDVCMDQRPDLASIRPGHSAACHFYDAEVNSAALEREA